MINAFLITFFLWLQPTGSSSKWEIDNANSNVNFAFQWNQNSFRTGEYKVFNGSIITVDKYSYENALVTFSAEVKSIDLIATSLSKVAQGPEYLDVSLFPTIEFKSTSLKKKKRNIYSLQGDLTIKGITKNVILKMEDHGVVVFEGKSFRSIRVIGTFDKNDYKIYGTDERLGNTIQLMAYFELVQIE